MANHIPVYPNTRGALPPIGFSASSILRVCKIYRPPSIDRRRSRDDLDAREMEIVERRERDSTHRAVDSGTETDRGGEPQAEADRIGGAREGEADREKQRKDVSSSAMRPPLAPSTTAALPISSSNVSTNHVTAISTNQSDSPPHSPHHVRIQNLPNPTSSTNAVSSATSGGTTTIVTEVHHHHHYYHHHQHTQQHQGKELEHQHEDKQEHEHEQTHEQDQHQQRSGSESSVNSESIAEPPSPGAQVS